jgi:MbtH protein
MEDGVGGDTDEDSEMYRVVVNNEEQYSIWPAGLQIPPGWEQVGKEAPKSECLSYIREVWVDMRPRSLRIQMDGGANEH